MSTLTYYLTELITAVKKFCRACPRPLLVYNVKKRRRKSFRKCPKWVVSNLNRKIGRLDLLPFLSVTFQKPTPQKRRFDGGGTTHAEKRWKMDFATFKF
jgi:hypothetical protein